MKKYETGYTCGVFDVLHVGHLNLLERCKSQCDRLIVGVCDDAYVTDVKGTTPIMNEEERLRIIRALKCVDDAYLVDIPTTEDKLLAHKRFGFDVLFSGSDWKGSERYNRTERELGEVGAEIVYFPYTDGISTSDLKVKILESEK